MTSPYDSSNLQFAQQPMVVSTPKSKIVALLLCFFLGGLGMHNFYIGHNVSGVIQLLLSVVFSPIIGFLTFGMGSLAVWGIVAIWVLIEFFMIALSISPYDADSRGITLA
ncbi:NINE protein [Corynebacterium diphtheriae]|uniref:NINE protein n=1 Tax=Corynebacterium diphtheriae TaxID=1717 RepID=UPI0018C9A21A|nr:NINE protein [Corynebacterium diphtheriae]MBN4650946.1 NINE protein [Corynebacterium diphtheriae bv. mitis]MBN4652857.1 NINE protein [Corynebacterium diphtheriae bv. mitis]